MTTVPYRDFIGANGTEQEREMRNDGVHLYDAGMSQVGDWLVDKVFFETSGN